jgi:hypothetical protein
MPIMMSQVAAPNLTERRSHSRVPCRIRVQICVAGGEPVVAEITNLSEQGLFVRPDPGSVRGSLRMTFVLGAGKALTFRLRVAGDAVEREARGRVAWRSDLGVGIDFIEIDQPLRDFIGRLVAAGDGVSTLLAAIEPDPVVEVG